MMLQPYRNTLCLRDWLCMLQRRLVAIDLAGLDKYQDSKYWEKNTFSSGFFEKITPCYRTLNAGLCALLSSRFTVLAPNYRIPLVHSNGSAFCLFVCFFPKIFPALAPSQFSLTVVTVVWLVGLEVAGVQVPQELLLWQSMLHWGTICWEKLESYTA